MQMNQQTRPVTSGISINSQYFINQLEATIIQIAKCLSIEHQVPVDPEAKEMTREIVQMKINTLLSKETLDEIKKINVEIADKIKNSTNAEVRKLAIQMFHLLKLVSLDV